MSYVRANTAPPFGMRSQALYRTQPLLGYYIPGSYPLPTTSMSAPGHFPGRLGAGGAFYDLPYSEYPIQENSRTRSTATLQGEWQPPTPPGRALFEQGAVTYRINPQTGKYEFKATDLVPRGLFQQSTFQHPVRSALSSLGVPISPRGVSLVQMGGRNVLMKTTPPRGRFAQGPTSQDPMLRLRAAFSGMFSGGGCGCHGKCGHCLGDVGSDTHIDPNTGCVVDSDGNLLTCPTSAGAQQPTIRPSPVTPTDPGLLQQLTQGGGALQQIANGITAATAPPRVVAPAVQTPSWFTGTTIIGGTAVPTMLLAGGALIAIAAMSGGKRR